MKLTALPTKRGTIYVNPEMVIGLYPMTDGRAILSMVDDPEECTADTLTVIDLPIEEAVELLTGEPATPADCMICGRPLTEAERDLERHPSVVGRCNTCAS
jgi:hypothetical protein